MHIKDFLKDLAHQLPFVPYRKPSKRRKSWNNYREKKFLRAVNVIYNQNSSAYNAIKASVIMPAFNRAPFIGNAISSILNQTHQNWELIVVDDGSTDNLDDIMERFKEEERVKLITQPHSGVSKARNTGLDNANGKYIFFLDTDNTWYPYYLRTMITFMETGKLEACYSAARIVNDENQTIGYFGEPFNWRECLDLNHIDINAFAHIKKPGNRKHRFDETLKRLVDWDYILAITVQRRTAYAPFIGINYYDGIKCNRITFTQHPGNQIEQVINQIQNKHKETADKLIPSKNNKGISWKTIIENHYNKKITTNNHPNNNA